MDAFDELLAPLDRAAFFRDSWGKAPLHIRGDGKKFDRLPGLAEIPALMAGQLSPTGWTQAGPAQVDASFVDAKGGYRSFSAPMSSWSGLYNAGMSLCLGRVDRFDERLARFADGFRSITRLPGTIAMVAYVTPPSSGSSMHFDRQHAVFLQVSGEKLWTHGSRSAWTDPPLNLGTEVFGVPEFERMIQQLGVPPVARPEETGMVQTLLRAGDALYLPPGVWHEARTTEQHSLHYTLTFEPMIAWKVIYAYLRMHLLREPSWRQDLRYSIEAGGSPPPEVMASALAALQRVVAEAKPAELLALFKQLLPPDGQMNEYFGTK